MSLLVTLFLTLFVTVFGDPVCDSVWDLLPRVPLVHWKGTKRHRQASCRVPLPLYTSIDRGGGCVGRRHNCTRL